MPERDIRERDILVASNEFAYVQDLTKGDIVLYVGPTKISLSNTERLVELRNDRFVPVRGDEGSVGVSPFITAASSQYVILENPPKDPASKPVKGSNSAIELRIGRKVVVSGPASFPLWPGQKAKVIGGHELREDEYLIARVYDSVDGDGSPIGTEKVIKGADVSFYIPATGLEVIPAEKGGYVRKARRLRKNMGLHVRIVKPFEAGEGEQVPAGKYAAGQDLFLRDREGFFFPTEALEVVGEVSATPLAEREGIYVRELETGKISTIVGPCNYLPDPTRVEIVARELDEEHRRLYGVAASSPRGPRALSIYIPPSFAVLVTAKDKREVVRGPKTRILDFDEDLEVLTLSTGRPKTDEVLLPTCFLQIEGNKVSDVVRVKTADHVELELWLSYRVSFVTKDVEAERWFNVKNYVGLLCDHLASILRAAARATPIETLHGKSADVLRSAILGEKRGEERRVGRLFEENGMWVYDVEVLDVRILDEGVKKLLADAQRAAITSEVGRRQEEIRLANEELKERVSRGICAARLATLAKEVELEAAKSAVLRATAAAAMDLDHLEKVGRAKNEAEALSIASGARLAAAREEAALRREATEAGVAAFKEQMAALSPELVTTLKMLGNKHFAAELTKNLAPLAILGGESVSDVMTRLLAALPIGVSEGGEGIRRLFNAAAPGSDGG